jgi:hypothetical protein
MSTDIREWDSAEGSASEGPPGAEILLEKLSPKKADVAEIGAADACSGNHHADS